MFAFPLDLLCVVTSALRATCRLVWSEACCAFDVSVASLCHSISRVASCIFVRLVTWIILHLAQVITMLSLPFPCVHFWCQTYMSRLVVLLDSVGYEPTTLSCSAFVGDLDEPDLNMERRSSFDRAAFVSDLSCSFQPCLVCLKSVGFSVCLLFFSPFLFSSVSPYVFHVSFLFSFAYPLLSILIFLSYSFSSSSLMTMLTQNTLESDFFRNLLKSLRGRDFSRRPHRTWLLWHPLEQSVVKDDRPCTANSCALFTHELLQPQAYRHGSGLAQIPLPCDSVHPSEQLVTRSVSWHRKVVHIV